MLAQNSDDTLEQLEEEIRTSRTQAWDVEEFLARRHQAKIEALTTSDAPSWTKRWAATKELLWAVMGLVGVYVVIGTAFLSLLSGRLELPWQRQERCLHVLPGGQPNLIPPPKAPALHQP